ncbi:hypothetical protein KY346_02440 [Candidatus Woesearchaeota archaeon]|nr:hypothetical protein [Candidatus Woesearchaeota archaeon]
MELRKAIEKKPWAPEEKARVLDIIERGRKQKPRRVRIADELAYWMFLLLAIVGNFVLSVILVPFMLILSGFYLFGLLFLLGFAFGLLINVILKEIQKIEVKQHIIPILLIVALALINIYIIARFTNKLELLLQLPTPAHNPLLVSATYVIAFTLPYLYSEYKRATRKNK